MVKKVAEECYKVLKPDHCCAILIGDTRKHRHYIPVSVMVLKKFLETGFVLKKRHNKTPVENENNEGKVERKV